MIGRRSHDDAQSFEDAWAGRAPRDEHVAELVRFVESLCEAAVVEPSTEFRTSLRNRLMDEAGTVLVPMAGQPRTEVASHHVAHPLRRRVAAVTTALVASAGVIGLVASSASAVPGELLYPVKRSVESVELALHRDDASRGSLQLAQASERLAEARELVDKGASDELIAESLDDFSGQAESGSTALFSDFSDHGKKQSIRAVNDFAVSSTTDLSELSARLPSGAASTSFDAATTTISDLATRASSLCAACSPGDVRQLVNAVTRLARTTTTDEKAAVAKDKAAKKAKADRKATAAGTPTPGPTRKPVLTLPTTPTTKAPSLGDVTDPLVGGLLGDDDQEGLVPGLLNGLSGNRTN